MSRNRVLLPYRLRTVRTGVIATVLVLSALVFVPLLGSVPEINRVAYFALVGLAFAGGGLVAALPWRRLFERGVGMAFMYAWSILDIFLIAGVVAATGGASSDFFWLFTLTTFFFASSYPPPGQLALLTLTLAVYLTTLVVLGDPLDPGAILERFAILGTLTFMAAFLFRELARQMAASTEAREDSDRRSALLATVARATRGMTALDSEVVLSAVVDGTVQLGFEAAALCFYDEAAGVYRPKNPRGLPRRFVDAAHPIAQGMPGLVRERRRTVVVDDYTDHPKAAPALRSSSFRSSIATPVWVQGRLEAALVAGTRRRMEIGPEATEALELLATQAGMALENARRFEEQRRTVERLAELDRLKSDFISNVSHELRTPLTVIEGMGITLDERWASIDDERRRDFLRRMNANAWTLDAVITRLLDFSRLEAGRMDVERQPVDLSELVEDVVARLGTLLPEDVLNLVVEPNLVVSGDPALLDRVIENLVSNAEKHTPEHTPVEVAVGKQDGYAVVSVSDRGPGIPPQDLRHLGERFFRGGDTNTRSTRGTGLGLAFARQILELHGSHLDIESSAGRGSSFSFRLPVVEDQPVVEQAKPESVGAGPAPGM